MIKRLNKIVAGITAAAALLLAAGCKNQLDYVDDTTARNAFNVAGLYVTGLDSSYNGAPVSLQVVTAIADNGDKTEESWFATEVAYSYKDASGNVVGYQSGTAYKKEAKLYDGDALAVKTYAKNAKVFAASSIECYLKVGSDTFKVVSSDGTKLENAKLSVPTSPAGTKDKDLSSKWVTVTIKDGIATFALAGNADEPVNVTLPTIKLDILAKTADTLSAAIKIEKVAKTGTNQKFTLKLTGLKEHEGTEFILGGADISLTDGSLGSYWYDEKFKSKISDNGEIEWTFYGSAVNNGNISAWGRTYSSEQAGPEILIAKADDPKKENGMQLLASGVSRNGVKGDSENFMFPAYTIGNYDVTCTIDVAKLTKGTDYTQADPEAQKYSYQINAITVKGEGVAKAKTDAGNKKLYFMDSTLTGETAWSPDSENCISVDDISLSGDVGTATFKIKNPVTFYPAGEYSLAKTPGFQLVYLKSGKSEFGKSWENVEKILKGTEFSKIWDYDYANKKVTLVADIKSDNVEFDYEISPIYISEVKVINSDVQDGTKIYFLDNSLLNTQSWDESAITTGTITKGAASYKLSSAKEITADKIGCQIVYIKSGESTFGGSWENVIKIATDKKQVENNFDYGTYKLVYDAAKESYSLEK